MTASSSTLLAEAKKLSPGDRLELIGELWDTLEDSDLPVATEEQEILEIRMADLEANPSAQESWSQAKSWLESRRR
jgi:putative addiction module component (TIGR02574 family)